VEIESELTAIEEEDISNKKFEDMTNQEIQQELLKKRQNQMSRMMKIRKYQFLAMIMLGFSYVFIYRPYVHPKSLMNSVQYHYALKIIQDSKMAKRELGDAMTVMTCNGKHCPLFSKGNFYLMIFGPENKAKFDVDFRYEASKKAYIITKINMITRSRLLRLYP